MSGIMVGGRLPHANKYLIKPPNLDPDLGDDGVGESTDNLDKHGRYKCEKYAIDIIRDDGSTRKESHYTVMCGGGGGAGVKAGKGGKFGNGADGVSLVSQLLQTYYITNPKVYTNDNIRGSHYVVEYNNSIRIESSTAVKIIPKPNMYITLVGGVGGNGACKNGKGSYTKGNRGKSLTFYFPDNYIEGTIPPLKFSKNVDMLNGDDISKEGYGGWYWEEKDKLNPTGGYYASALASASGGSGGNCGILYVDGTDKTVLAVAGGGGGGSGYYNSELDASNKPPESNNSQGGSIELVGSTFTAYIEPNKDLDIILNESSELELGLNFIFSPKVVKPTIGATIRIDVELISGRMLSKNLHLNLVSSNSINHFSTKYIIYDIFKAYIGGSRDILKGIKVTLTTSETCNTISNGLLLNLSYHVSEGVKADEELEPTPIPSLSYELIRCLDNFIYYTEYVEQITNDYMLSGGKVLVTSNKLHKINTLVKHDGSNSNKANSSDAIIFKLE